MSLLLLVLLAFCLRAEAVDLEVEGLCPSVFTPFDLDGKLNVDVIPAYAKYLSNNGVKGVLLCGTAGEGPALSMDERKQLLTAWVREGKRLSLRVVMQVGGQPMPEVIEMAKFAENASADAILTLPELYYKPKDENDIVRYLSIISDAAPKMPILYYHHVSMTGIRIRPAKFFKKASYHVPNFKGIKCDLVTALDIIASDQIKEDQRIFLMRHVTWSANLMMGLNSSMTATISLFPKLFVSIQQAVASNNVARTRQLQLELNARVAAITDLGDYVPACKAAMESLAGLRLGSTRDPLKSVTIEQVKAIEQALRDMDIKYPAPPPPPPPPPPSTKKAKKDT